MLSEEERNRLFGGLPDDDDEDQEVTFDELPDDDDEDLAADMPDCKEGWWVVEGGIGGCDAKWMVSLWLSPEDTATLADYIVKHKTRIISLKLLREIAPDTFNSLEDMEGEVDIVHWPDSDLRTCGLLLQDEVLERAFDVLFNEHIAF